MPAKTINVSVAVPGSSSYVSPQEDWVHVGESSTMQVCVTSGAAFSAEQTEEIGIRIETSVAGAPSSHWRTPAEIDKWQFMKPNTSETKTIATVIDTDADSTEYALGGFVRYCIFNNSNAMVVVSFRIELQSKEA